VLGRETTPIADVSRIDTGRIVARVGTVGTDDCALVTDDALKLHVGLDHDGGIEA
jgi:hypothetical protein